MEACRIRGSSRLTNTFYMTYALRPCAMNYYPTGTGLPERSLPQYPDGWGEEEVHWMTRSGILASKDLIHWEYVSIGSIGYLTPVQFAMRFSA